MTDKNLNVAVAALAVVGIIGYHLTNDYLSVLVICAVIGGFVWFVRKILTFAKENPEMALMGGATYFAWKQAELASKDSLKPPETPAIANPTTADESLVRIEDKR